MTAAATAILEAFEAGEMVHPEPPLPLRRESGDADSFPVDALGPIIGPAVAATAETVQVPAAICAQSALSNVAMAVQGHADIVLPIMGSLPSPVSLYFFSVATSGDRKTKADKLLGNATAEAFCAELESAHRLALANYHNADEAYQSARAAAKNTSTKGGTPSSIKAALDAVGEAPRRPRDPHLIFSDATIEGLFKAFKEGQPSMGMFCGEGGTLVGGHSMNADNQTKTAGGYNSLWDGGTLRRLRSGDGPSVLRQRRLSMHVMIQPLLAEKWLSDPVLRDQGLFSRLLICAPKSLQGTRPHRDPTPEATQALDAFNSHLSKLLNDRPLFNEEGELELRTIGMTADAQALWKSFANQVECQQGENGTLYPIRGMASKAAENAARLAAVMGLCENPRLMEIDLALLRRGVALAQWYVDEALRLALDECVPPEMKEAEKLLGWLHELDGTLEGGMRLFPLVDVYQRGPYTLRDAEAAKRTIKILQDHRWVDQVEGTRRFRDSNGKMVTRREVYRVRKR